MSARCSDDDDAFVAGSLTKQTKGQPSVTATAARKPFAPITNSPRKPPFAHLRSPRKVQPAKRLKLVAPAQLHINVKKVAAYCDDFADINPIVEEADGEAGTVPDPYPQPVSVDEEVLTKEPDIVPNPYPQYVNPYEEALREHAAPAEGLPSEVEPHVGSKRFCSHPGCNIKPHFVLDARGKRWCGTHKTDAMFDIRNKHRPCEYPGCLKEGRQGGRLCYTHRDYKLPAAAPKHVLPDGVDPHVGLVKYCSQGGCTNLNPQWVLAIGGARWCYDHKTDDMFRLDKAHPSRNCAELNCTKTPHYNEPGLPAKYCREHAELTMVNPEVFCRPPSCFCKRAGCECSPFWGMPGEGKSVCTAHKCQGMIRYGVVCTHPECNIGASYALPGERPVRCLEHRQAGQVNVVSLSCSWPDCWRLAKWGESGEKPTWCVDHKASYHVLRSGKCAHALCNTAGSFRFPGSKKAFCSWHKQPGMLHSRTKLCQEEGCTRYAQMGPAGQPAETCWHHVLDGFVRTHNACCECHFRCSSLHPLRENHCARCFISKFPWVHIPEERKIREFTIMEALRQEMPIRCPDIPWRTATFDMTIPGGTSAKRPDFFLSLDFWNVVFEADEHQHSSQGYSQKKEQVRNLLLHEDGKKKPLWIIRLNPDGYTKNGKRHLSSFMVCEEKGEKYGKLVIRDPEEWNGRLVEGFDWLQHAVTFPPPKPVQEVFLFYDE